MAVPRRLPLVAALCSLAVGQAAFAQADPDNPTCPKAMNWSTYRQMRFTFADRRLAFVSHGSDHRAPQYQCPTCRASVSAARFPGLRSSTRGMAHEDLWEPLSMSFLLSRGRVCLAKLATNMICA